MPKATLDELMDSMEALLKETNETEYEETERKNTTQAYQLPVSA